MSREPGSKKPVEAQAPRAPYRAPLFATRPTGAAGRSIPARTTDPFKYLARALQRPRVTIQELLVLPDGLEQSYGESQGKNRDELEDLEQKDRATGEASDHCSADDLERLKKHMTDLMTQAASAHDTSRGPHHITRLSMPEFALFTKAPLTEKQYNNLKNWLVDQAKDSPENVHVLFSTVAVIINNELCSIALHTTCGVESARVDPIIKAQASDFDIAYEADQALYSEDKSEDILESELCLTVPVADTSIQVVVEVCLDHGNHRGDHMLREQLTEHHATPGATSHIVSSNPIRTEREGMVCGHVTQVDPRFSRADPRFNAGSGKRLDDPAFGPAVTIHDFGINAVEELTPELETLRRQQLVDFYSRKLSCDLSTEAVTEEIESAWEAGHFDKAIDLLQLLPNTPDALLTQMAETHLNDLPSKELNQVISIGMALTAEQTEIICQRANELTPDNLNVFVKTLDLEHLSANSLSCLAQQAEHYNAEQIDRFFDTPGVFDQLTAYSINTVACHAGGLTGEQLIQLVDRFTELNTQAINAVFDKIWLLESSQLSIIAANAEMLTTDQLSKVCQEVWQLDRPAIDQLLTRIDDMNSSSISSIAAEMSSLTSDQLNQLLTRVDQFSSRDMTALIQLLQLPAASEATWIALSEQVKKLDNNQFEQIIKHAKHMPTEALENFSDNAKDRPAHIMESLHKHAHPEDDASSSASPGTS